MLNTPFGVNLNAAHRFVRRKTALGVLFEGCKSFSRKGDPLNFKINGFLRSLQQELLASEGWPSAALQQEACDAYPALTPQQQEESNSPEIRAYFERNWGPIKNRELQS